MRQLSIAGLLACLLTLAACGGEGDDAATIHSASPVPIQDKTWSVPYGVAHDGETSQIAFNASGPVAMAWWHIEATSPTTEPPYTFVCTLRTRSWLNTGGWGSVENLMGPGPSDSSYRCGEVDVYANSTGDALVVANPTAPAVATLFRRLVGETNWRQPATAMSAGAGLRSTVVARIVEGGEVRQVDFQYAVGDADVALDSYRYATRRWERSGAVQAALLIQSLKGLGASFLVPITFTSASQAHRLLHRMLPAPRY